MTDLVRYQEPAPRSWLELMVPAAELAKSIADTDFVPKAFRGKPAAIAAAILYGDELGIGPMQALAKVSVIEGKPSLAAESQRALIQAAGHELWLEEATNTKVTWAGKRAGSDDTIRITWSMDDAKRARLDGRPNWRTYPRQMLSARASAELARAMFADVIGGMAATEELEGPGFDNEDLEGAALAPAPARKRSRKRADVTASARLAEGGGAPAATRTEGGRPPLPGEEGYGKLSPHEAATAAGAPSSGAAGGPAGPNLVAIACRDAGLDADGRHALCAWVSGGRTRSSLELEGDEVARARSAAIEIKKGRMGLYGDELVEIAEGSAAGEDPIGGEGPASLLDGAGWARAGDRADKKSAAILKEARKIAGELGLDLPRDLDHIPAEVATILEKWLDDHEKERA